MRSKTNQKKKLSARWKEMSSLSLKKRRNYVKHLLKLGFEPTRPSSQLSLNPPPSCHGLQSRASLLMRIMEMLSRTSSLTFLHFQEEKMSVTNFSRTLPSSLRMTSSLTSLTSPWWRQKIGYLKEAWSSKSSLLTMLFTSLSATSE